MAAEDHFGDEQVQRRGTLLDRFDAVLQCNAFVQDVQLRLRDDTVTEPDARAANQASAPAVEAGLFLVPRVIE